MLYASLTDYPVLVPIGIFLVSIILYEVKELINYAQVLWSKRAQQTNLAIFQTHLQVRVLQKEAKARMSFFDQLDQCLQQQRNQTALEGTPSPSWEPEVPSTVTQASTSKTEVDEQPDRIALTPRTKTAKNTFVRKYPKTVMAQPLEGIQEMTPTSEEIMSVTDYMKAVRVGHIKAGLNHEHIKDLAQLPHAGQTKVIVLMYETRKPAPEQPKST